MEGTNGKRHVDEKREEEAEEKGVNTRPAVLAVAAIVLTSLYLDATVSGRQSLLFLIGAAAGVILYHAAFGFTSAWRVFAADRRGAGLRAQMLMLAATTAVFVPVLADGHFFGQAVRGSISPVGVSVIAGAFLFGAGMQLGGGCASGTLYTAGGGNTRMLATLVAFIAGSLVGTAHMPWWTATPSLKPIGLVAALGAPGALAVSMAGFAALTALTIVLETRRHGALTRAASVPKQLGGAARSRDRGRYRPARSAWRSSTSSHSPFRADRGASRAPSRSGARRRQRLPASTSPRGRTGRRRYKPLRCMGGSQPTSAR
jgi:uncharacterized membrane protein YedE/YeeE